MFKNTHHFLPARGGNVIPNSLHVGMHALFAGALVLSIASFFAPPSQRIPGYIGVKIDATHPGITSTKKYIETKVQALLAGEVYKRLPGFKGELPTFSHSKNRFHTTVAYLCEPTQEQCAHINTQLRQLTASGGISSGTAYLSNHLNLFGKSKDTIVMTLHDQKECLRSLHRGCEHMLEQLTSTHPDEKWYTPWQHIGNYIPHISFVRIRFRYMKEFIEKHGGDTENLVESIQQKVLSDICAPFELESDNKTLHCNELIFLSTHTLPDKHPLYRLAK